MPREQKDKPGAAAHRGPRSTLLCSSSFISPAAADKALDGHNSAPTAIQDMLEAPDIIHPEVTQPSFNSMSATTGGRDNHSRPPVAKKRQAASHPSSEPNSKKPRVEITNSDGSSLWPTPSDLVHTSSPPASSKTISLLQPTPLKSILKRRQVETSPGSPPENPEPSYEYNVGMYHHLFNQRDVSDRVLRADYKKESRSRSATRKSGKKPQTIFYLANRGNMVENLNAKFFYRDDFPNHALVENEDEEDNEEEDNDYEGSDEDGSEEDGSEEDGSEEDGSEEEEKDE
ncbi:hypothetical protein RUND412_004749 [Rhizina undulata]